MERGAVYFFSIFLLFTWQRSIVHTENPELTLKLVQVIFRHGDRTPDKGERYPNDPYDAKYWAPMGYGVLTKMGEKHAYKFGELLRAKYGDFLGPYREEFVHAFSTDFQRTKRTLQLVLNGLYPAQPNQPWSESMHVRPFPAQFLPNARNFLRPIRRKQCPRYASLYEQAVRSPELWAQLDKYQDFIDRVRRDTGFIDQPIKTGSRLLANLRAVDSMGLPQPIWCSRQCARDLYALASINNDVYVRTHEMQRMVVGPTLDVLLKKIYRNEREARDQHKIFLYSAHDINIATIARALRLKDVPEIPDYCSALIFEKLVDKTNKIYVRISYYTGVTNQLIPIKLRALNVNLVHKAFPYLKSKNCPVDCPLDTFLNIVHPLMPHAEDKQCHDT